MASSSWATPGAILIGFSMVAVATYFGLHDHRPADVASPAASASSVASTGSAATAPKSNGYISPATTLLAPDVAAAGTGANAEASAAFELQRPALVAACGGPADGTRKPAHYEFNFSFDPAGHEVGRGLNELQDVRPEVTACILAHRVPLEIPARGTRSQAHVKFSVP